MGRLTKVLQADGSGKRLSVATALAEHIREAEAGVAVLSDDEILQAAAAQRARVRDGADIDEELVEAFALTREVTRRELGLRMYDVQLIGGLGLHWGAISEMRTGEGKTIVAYAPAYLNSLLGEGVHVTTSNQYLAARDAAQAARVLARLGCSVGLTASEGSVDDKRAAYVCDITYGTPSEFGFDYLRDSTVQDQNELMTRGTFPFAIVDEVDAVLIDEARTPLIMSGKQNVKSGVVQKFVKIVDQMKENFDYEVDREQSTFALTEAGHDKAGSLLGVDLSDVAHIQSAGLLHQALHAKVLLRKDVDYVISDGKVEMVDENTGRVLPGRRWSSGLHQAVEARVGVEILPDNRTLASVTLQHFYRGYDKLAGMTGTAKSDAAELDKIYELQVVQVPTNRPVIRVDHSDIVWQTAATKLDAVVEEIIEVHATGRPVLIGTTSVADSEVASKRLRKAGIAHEVLNAKNHLREAEIVAQAGRLGAVTVSTNMAGRGVDIILGGNVEGLVEHAIAEAGFTVGSAEADEVARRVTAECAEGRTKVLAAGGLHVIGLARHESRRVDDQLRGRAGRQGDPGSSRFHLSLDDDLLEGLANGPLGMAARLDRPLDGKMVSKAVEKCQSGSESRNAKARQDLFDYDEVRDTQRRIVYGERFDIVTCADSELFAMVETAGGKMIELMASRLGKQFSAAQIVADIGTNLWPTKLTADDLEGLAERAAVTVMGADFHDALLARHCELDDTVFDMVARRCLFGVLDAEWLNHMEALDVLEEGIGLRQSAQINPLVAWKTESGEMFTTMMRRVRRRAVSIILTSKIEVTKRPPAGEEPAAA